MWVILDTFLGFIDSRYCTISGYCSAREGVFDEDDDEELAARANAGFSESYLNTWPPLPSALHLWRYRNECWVAC